MNTLQNNKENKHGAGEKHSGSARKKFIQKKNSSAQAAPAQPENSLAGKTMQHPGAQESSGPGAATNAAPPEYEQPQHRGALPDAFIIRYLAYLVKPLLFFLVVVLAALVLLLPDIRKNWVGYFDDLLNTVSGHRVLSFEERWQNFEELVYHEKFPAASFYSEGKLYHLYNNGLNAEAVAREYLPFTSYLAASQLRKALTLQPVLPAAEITPGSSYTKAVEVPGFADNPKHLDTLNIPERRASAKIQRRGIYLHGTSAGGEKIFSHIKNVKTSNANALVYDIKDVVGYVNYPTRYTVAEKIQKDKNFGYGAPIKSIPKLLNLFRENDIYGIARFSLFQDRVLAKAKPEWAIKNKSGGLFTVGGKPIWVDPGYADTRSYLLEIVWELALMGVDELQFDYIRYPAEGKLEQVRYYGVKDYRDKVRHIRNFLMQAQSILTAHNALTSIDVFGIVAWGEIKDVQSTGQDLDQLSYFADIISPMLYPSHFSDNFEGIKNPADSPFRFIQRGSAKVIEITENRAVVRPWLQSFPWKVSNYNADYIRLQIEGAKSAGAQGWLMWNAKNKYETVYNAISGGKETKIN